MHDGAAQPPENLESDHRFSSGRWTGYWQQGTVQARMRLTLTFSGGVVSGEGSDPVGPFTFRGTYDVGSGRCDMVKHYQSHRVRYTGDADEDGIRGQWEIRRWVFSQRGAFALWPSGEGIAEHEELEAEEPVPG